MGAFFIGGQVYEYTALVANEGMTLSSTPTARSSTSPPASTACTSPAACSPSCSCSAARSRPPLHPRPGDQRDRRLVLLALRRRGVDRAVRHDLPHQVSEPVTRPRATPAAPSSGRCRRRRRHRLRSGAAPAAGPRRHRRRLHRVRARQRRPGERPACSSQAVDEGRALYLTSCSSCHGLNAEGGSDGPEPDRRRCGRGRLPGRAPAGCRCRSRRRRPAQAACSSPRRDRRARRLRRLARPRPGDPRRGALDYADGDLRRGRRDLPHQLRDRATTTPAPAAR